MDWGGGMGRLQRLCTQVGWGAQATMKAGINERRRSQAQQRMRITRPAMRRHQVCAAGSAAARLLAMAKGSGRIGAGSGA